MRYSLPKLNRLEALSLTGIGIAFFVAVWYAAVWVGLTPRKFLPTPLEVLAEVLRLSSEAFAGYTLPEHLVSSFKRFFYGFALAVIVATPLGLLMALFRPIRLIVSPIFESVRFVAPIAWVPFAALWFGTGIGGPLLVIFMGAFPPMLINTFRGALYVDHKYLEAARMLGAGPVRQMTEVLLPAAAPSIVAGLRISAGLGWQSLVGAELIVASSGVGYMMVKGQAGIQTATVMSGMLAIGIVGLVIDTSLRQLERRMARYKEIH